MIKKITVSIILLIIPLVSFSQVQGFNLKFEVINPNQAGKIFKNPTSETYRILGSPYTESKFAYAEVENVAQKYFMRYNAYSDNFEFITFQNDTLAMDRIDNFSNITFTKPHKKYSYLNYISKSKGRGKGYLVELYTNADFSLYKKEAITFYAGKKAKTSLESDLPASYSQVKYSYFFKNKGVNIVQFPDSKKQFIKLYPDKKSEIESFVKENKISFDEEEDMKKIIDLLTTF